MGSGVRYVNGITSDRLNTHTLPSYTLVDMVIGYDLTNIGIKGLSAQLNVNNLTDKRYVAACNSLSYCYFGAERSIVGSVSGNSDVLAGCSAGALSGLVQCANCMPDERSSSGIVDCGYCVKPFCIQICALVLRVKATLSGY